MELEAPYNSQRCTHVVYFPAKLTCIMYITTGAQETKEKEVMTFQASRLMDKNLLNRLASFQKDVRPCSGDVLSVL